MKRTSTYPLRLPASLKEAVAEISRAEGTSMNQFVVMAVAEKISAMSVAEYFERRRDAAGVDAALRILDGKAASRPMKTTYRRPTCPAVPEAYEEAIRTRDAGQFTFRRRRSSRLRGRRRWPWSVQGNACASCGDDRCRAPRTPTGSTAVPASPFDDQQPIPRSHRGVDLTPNRDPRHGPPR